ncbi:unnamed protein product [Oikopleura dioica]|uniref:Activator of basal transcription 1 n=1 Tax=Oikopleura dioica TaxID=34765 RepID=E4WTU5_OIKDI|nr:unnamed protein product [Oikopleura dioica]
MGEIEKEIVNSPERELESKNEDKEEDLKVIPVVIYISTLPKGMGPVHLRQILSQFGELDRIYCAANYQRKKSTHRYKEDDFKEGWVEFKKKKNAKKAVEMLNGQTIEAKKKTKFQGQLWNMKYLSKTRWHHLTEQLHYEEQVRKKRMDAELSQVKRETDAFVKNLDASKKQSAILERKKRKGVHMDLKIEDRFQSKMRKVVDKKERKTKLAAKLFA